MGDESELETMLRVFTDFYGEDTDDTTFNWEDGYFLIKKGDEKAGKVSDAWDNFKIGWQARGEVDEKTISGW